MSRWNGRPETHMDMAHCMTPRVAAGSLPSPVCGAATALAAVVVVASSCLSAYRDGGGRRRTNRTDDKQWATAPLHHTHKRDGWHHDEGAVRVGRACVWLPGMSSRALVCVECAVVLAIAESSSTILESIHSSASPSSLKMLKPGARGGAGAQGLGALGGASSEKMAKGALGLGGGEGAAAS